MKIFYFTVFTISLLSAFIFSTKQIFSENNVSAINQNNESHLKNGIKNSLRSIDATQPADAGGKSGKWEELFFKANQFHKDGKYEDALNTYLEVLRAGHACGDLYYNMGNTCYRLNMIGHAILYFERARIFIPRDPDLDYNIRYVKKMTKDAVENQNSLLTGIFFWTGSMTQNESFILFAIINVFLWASLILRIYFKKEWTYFLPIIFLVMWMVTGISFGWKFYSDSTDSRAVVLDETADVLSGPETGDTLLFQLHSGTIVQQEKSEDDWKLIRLPDKKRGWIRGSSIEKIQLNIKAMKYHAEEQK